MLRPWKSIVKICLICLVILTLGLAGCSWNGAMVSTITTNQTQELHQISGKVYDATMHTIIVQTNDGETYAFEKNPETLTTGEQGTLIGNPVTVSFYGTVQQPSQVVKIVVSDSEQTLAPSMGKAQQILADMTLEEKVGQMFIARCPEKNASQLLGQYHLGGYILFGEDFAQQTPQTITETIEDYQHHASIPLLIAVDEEGGKVNRLSAFPAFRATPFASSQALYQQGKWQAIINDTKEKSALLHSLGINVNMAPVCDVSQNPEDYIYPRAFGQDAQQTAQYVQTVVTAMNEAKIGSVLKHFPGYGNNADTHQGIAYDHRSYQTFVESDFLPFQAGIAAGAQAILVSHNIVNCMDETLPASLSPKVHTILRDTLGFQGVIMTDDLYMEAIQQFTPADQAAVAAVLAGNDLLCCTDFTVQIPAVVKAVHDGTIKGETIDQSVLRILNWKIQLGIL